MADSEFYMLYMPTDYRYEVINEIKSSVVELCCPMCLGRDLLAFDYEHVLFKFSRVEWLKLNRVGWPVSINGGRFTAVNEEVRDWLKNNIPHDEVRFNPLHYTVNGRTNQVIPNYYVIEPLKIVSLDCDPSICKKCPQCGRNKFTVFGEYESATISQESNHENAKIISTTTLAAGMLFFEKELAKKIIEKWELRFKHYGVLKSSSL